MAETTKKGNREVLSGGVGFFGLSVRPFVRWSGCPVATLLPSRRTGSPRPWLAARAWHRGPADVLGVIDASMLDARSSGHVAHVYNRGDEVFNTRDGPFSDLQTQMGEDNLAKAMRFVNSKRPTL